MGECCLNGDQLNGESESLCPSIFVWVRRENKAPPAELMKTVSDTELIRENRHIKKNLCIRPSGNQGQHILKHICTHLSPTDEEHLCARAVTMFTMWANDFYRGDTWTATVFIGH